MATGRSIVLNGDLGSGKTTVSIMLAERLDIPRISVGDLYRTMAAQRGVTALELNLHAELDDKIDHYVDQLQRDISARGDQLIVDSRLAWHFFADAFKVHLVVEPTTAARRVLARPSTRTERYTSLDEARIQLAARSTSERARFLDRYGVDKTRLHNYDLVCDSTRATPEAIVDRVVTDFSTPTAGPPPHCYLDPQRIELPDQLVDGDEIVVEYHHPDFVLRAGRPALDAAIRDGHALVPVTLAAN